MGSSLAARRAGHRPKKRPTSALKPKAIVTAAGEISVFHCMTRDEGHRRADAEEHAEHAAHQAEHQRLDQELEHDVAPGGAERLAHADLPGPLGDRDQHDVHDPDAAHQEAHRGDAARAAW